MADSPDWVTSSAWTTWPSTVRADPTSRPWATKLEELGVKHGGIVDASYGSGLSFRDPDGNALEFFAAPGS